MSNMGYAFNRTVWQRIKASARIFCGFDDYGWDWSLECAVMARWEPELLSLHAAGKDSNPSLVFARVHFGLKSSN
jgi:hypothetical protein